MDWLVMSVVWGSGLFVLWVISYFMEAPFWLVWLVFAGVSFVMWLVRIGLLWFLYSLFLRDHQAKVVLKSFRDYKYPLPDTMDVDEYLLNIRMDKALDPETRIDAYGVDINLRVITQKLGVVTGMFYRSAVKRAMQMMRESAPL